MYYETGFIRCFGNPIRVPRIENRVPRIRERYQGRYLNGYCNQYYEMVAINALKLSRKLFGPLQVHAWYLKFSLKKTCYEVKSKIAQAAHLYNYV